MKLDELISLLSKKTDDEEARKLKDSLIKLKKLKDFKEIRMFLEESHNFGHTANSVNILKYLISSGFNGKITVVFEVDGEAQRDNTENCLAVLIPYFEKGKETQIISVDDGEGTKKDVEFITLDAFDPETEAELGITGGFDNQEHMSPCLKLYVRYFLALQPYRWEQTGAVTAIYANEGNYEDTVISLYKYDKFIQERAFYLPMPKYNKVIWELYKEKEEYKGQIVLLEAFFSKYYESVNLCPVYGLRNNQTFLGESFEKSILTDLATAIIYAQSKNFQGNKNKCVIFVLNDKFDYAKFIDIIRMQKKELPLFNKYALKNKIDEKIMILNSKDISLFEEYINIFLKDPRKNVFVIQIGRLPLDIFNFVYSQATLPFVFEGAGTAPLALNLGKPFFWTQKQEPKYPFVFFGDKYKQVVSEFNGLYSILKNDLSQWPEDDKKTPAYIIGELICRCYSNETKYGLYGEYFKDIAVFFRDQTNSKLIHGLAVWMEIWKPKEELNAIQSDNNADYTADMSGTIIEQLYDSLLGQYSEGKSRIIPAFPDGEMKKSYMQIVRSGDPFIIEGDAPVLSQDKSKITITGKSNSLGIDDLDVKVLFTAEFGVISSEFTGVLKNTVWNLENISRFAMDTPELNIKIYDNLLPMPGSISGTITDIGLKVGLGFPILQNRWVLRGQFQQGCYLSINRIFHLVGVNILDSLPAPLNTFSNFGVSDVEIQFDASDKTISYINIRFQTDPKQGGNNKWEVLPNGWLTLDSLIVDCRVDSPLKPAERKVKFSIFSELEIVSDATVELSACIPGFQLTACLKRDSKPIELRKIVGKFLSPDAASLVPDSKITGFYMEIEPASKTFLIQGDIEANWVILSIPGLAAITLKELKLNLGSNNEGITGGIAGRVRIGKEEDKNAVDLFLSASYSKARGGWELAGNVSDVHLTKILAAFLGELNIELPSWTPDLEIRDVSVLVQTGSNYAYTVKGKADWKLQYEGVIDTTLFAELEIKYDKKASPEKPYSGVIKGGAKNIPVIGSDLMLGYKFEKDNKELFVQWRQITAKIIENKQKEKIIQVDIGKESIGSLIAYLVGLATGDHQYQLPSPWDLLNQINLEGFSLRYNLNTNKIEVNYELKSPINLVFIEITGLSLKTEEGSVVMSITGSSPIQSDEFKDLFDQDKGRDVKQLPEVPGMGSQYLDLRLLAMGQHVEFKTEKTTIDGVIEDMRGVFKEPASRKEIPIGFNPNNNWLFATDFGIMKEGKTYTVDLGIVFNDPLLYGLKLKMDGKYASVFKGLEFEILYKKITDSIGMFKAELTLPDQVRYLTFGEINIILPVVGIEIYTNGNFKIDFGFPYNHDFSRSFSVSGIVWAGYVPIPLMGSGGFYFGMLSGATSSKVPVTAKGLFNPVLEFGFGLQLGFGYVFSEGPLRAGFDVGVVGIIEGVIAKYSPYAPALAELESAAGVLDGDYYYQLQGVVGVQGRLYGTVDFSVISASFNVVVYVLAKVALEAYRAMTFGIAAGVKISLSVKIDLGLFSIKLSFSFSYELEGSFSIGRDEHTLAPWYDGHEAGLMVNGGRLSALQLKWKPLLKETGENPVVLNSYFVPNLNTSESDGSAGKNSSVNYAAMLFMETAVPGTPDSSFAMLCNDVFRWVVYAALDDENLTRSDLDQKTVTLELLNNISAELAGTGLTPIPYEKILEFLAELYRISIQLLKTGELSAALFPMIPELKLHIPAYNGASELDRDFKKYNQCTDDYLGKVKDYFNRLAVLVERESSKGPESDDAEDTGKSFATYVFEDYFLLIARQQIQTGIEILKAYQYSLQPGDSLDSITKWAKDRNNEVAPADIITSNSSHPLTVNKTIIINADKPVTHITSAGETWEAIADKYLVTMESLAAIPDNRKVEDVFETGILTIPNLTSLKVKDIIDNMGKSESAVRLSGMVSRYHLHGLRLPVGENLDQYSATKALMELTGQQFPIPAPLPDLKEGEEPYRIYLKKEPDVKWIALGGSQEQEELPVEINDKEIDRVNSVFKIAGTIKLPVESLTPVQNYLESGVRYSFKNVIRWESGDELSAEEKWRPLIWNFSEGLNRDLIQNKSVPPKFGIKIGTHNKISARLEYKKAKQYIWGTLVQVTIKKRDIGNGENGFSYDLLGTPEKDIGLLESLLTDSTAKAGIEDLRILYSRDLTGDEKEGLISDASHNIKSFITQSNLSTETNPPTAKLIKAEAESPSGILNPKADFIRLLWQCSIVRSGGYSLFYNILDSDAGLPDYLFNEDGTGIIYLMITYGERQYAGRYMNCAVTGDNIDPSNDPVFAESEEQMLKYQPDSSDCLASIRENYRISFGRMAELNQDKILRTGKKLRVGMDFYTVDPNHPAGNTMISIADYYGTGVIAIGSDSDNIKIPGLFTDGVILDIIDQFTYKSAIIPQGNSGFNMVRQEPGNVPPISDPAYAGVYLENLFSLLSYGLVENEAFSKTIAGLPVGPQKKYSLEQEQNPCTDVKDSDDPSEYWDYEQIVPVARYAKFNPIPAGIDESEQPPAEENPYSGIGQAIDLQLIWRDLYGNETTGGSEQRKFFIGYTDKLLAVSEWPGIGVQYTFVQEGTEQKLKVMIHFDPSRYEGKETGKDNAAADLKVYRRIYYQLNQKEKVSGKDHVIMKLETSLVPEGDQSVSYDNIKSFILEIYRYLYQKSSSVQVTSFDTPQIPDPEICKTIHIDYGETGIFKDSDIVSLEVSLSIERASHLIDNDFKDVEEVSRATTFIQPQTGNGDDKRHTLTGFAKNFEKIFNNAQSSYQLKIAAGQNKNMNGATEINVIRFGKNKGSRLYYEFVNRPVFYAPMPLSNQLESRTGVPVYSYVSGKGIDFTKPSGHVNLSGIDMDIWGRRFLEAVDLILSPEFAEPIFFIDRLSGNEFIKSLLKNKQSLAEAIRKQVTAILEEEPQLGQIDEAREKLYQQLLILLSNAYTIDAVVQYNVNVNAESPAPGFKAPRIFGKPVNKAGSNEGYSLSSTKISLPAGGKSSLNLLFSARSARLQKNVAVDIDFQSSHLEYEIEAVTGLEPYEISSWLSIVIPPDVKAIGPAEIPVPLREYPKEPSLTGQKGVPSDPQGREAVGNAVNWDYSYTYLADHAAQDEIHSKICFNITDGSRFSLAGPVYDLFNELAEFDAVSAKLNTDFSGALRKINAQTTTDTPEFITAKEAVKAFTDITTRVSEAWKEWNAGNRSIITETSQTVVEFTITESPMKESSQNNIPDGSLVVTLEFGASLVGIEDNIRVEIDGYASEFIHEKEFIYKNAEGEYLSFKEAQSLSRREVVVKNLNILQYQNALSAVSVTRNEDLIANRITNAPFIYRTPSIQFANRLIPLLNIDTEIDMAGGKKRSMTEHLAEFFKAFLDKASSIKHVEMQMECKYIYPITGKTENRAEIPITQPLLFITPFTFRIPEDYTPKDQAIGEDSPFVCRLANEIKQWLARNTPATSNARFHFAVSVFSEINGSKMPLIRLNQVILRYEDLT